MDFAALVHKTCNGCLEGSAGNAKLNAELGLGLVASDALLLARLPLKDAEKLSDEKQQMIAPFKRGDGYRFCLTPYFEDMEKDKRIVVIKNGPYLVSGNIPLARESIVDDKKGNPLKWK